MALKTGDQYLKSVAELKLEAHMLGIAWLSYSMRAGRRRRPFMQAAPYSTRPAPSGPLPGKAPPGTAISRGARRQANEAATPRIE